MFRKFSYSRPCHSGLFIPNVITKVMKSALPKKQPGKYYKTLNLPKTKFQAWIQAEKRVGNDEMIMKTCGFSELYSWQRENLKGEEFILHDGPPYANGFPHMGHTINKILKDIINRQKVLQGRKVHYVPGWDCHGLPIELKATAGCDTSSMTPVQIRTRARKYAFKAINDQRSIFKSWGVMGDWTNDGCYYTFDKSYSKNQLQRFWELYEKGLIYRDLKPVYWSPSSRTALAEAELEYNENHASQAVTVRLKVMSMNSLSLPVGNISSVYLLIWTTTPWSLPANVAVAVNPEIEYCLISEAGSNEGYVIARDLLEVWASKMRKQFEVINTMTGNDLLGWTYQSLNDDSVELPVVSGSHVTSTSGTGLVHTAPAHGHQDFLLSLQYNLPVKCVVNEAGNFTSEAGPKLEGSIATDVECEKILSHFKNSIIHQETITHSYPYDWRTKKPVIIRASRQWFIDTDKIKGRAVEILKAVDVYPTGSSALNYKLESRPYWCVSRQRVWGVPIPCLYSGNEETPIISQELINHCCDLMEKHGSDFWWSLPVSDIAPKDILEAHGGAENIVKGSDVMDIWLDSGLSWSAVLQGRVADLYLEGMDQFTGWFQSSLLTSVALQDRAPYKKIFVHGFAVDGNGRKMSKSLGNVIDPQDLIKISGNGRGKPYGLDIIRWWVGAHSVGSQRSNVSVSKTTLDDSSDAIFKIRNISRFILGSLQGYSLEPTAVPPKHLYVIDQYILLKLHDFLLQTNEYYDSYQFNKVCSSVINFIANDLSSFYCHIIKDRLYCEGDSVKREAAQYTLFHILIGLLQVIGPMVPVITEEINSFIPGSVGKSPFFMSPNYLVQREALDSEMKVFPVIDQALAVRALLSKSLPSNVNSFQIDADISASPAIYKILKILQKTSISSSSQLTEILQVSTVSLHSSEDETSVSVCTAPAKLFFCERCRRNTSEEKNSLCKRCTDVLM